MSDSTARGGPATGRRRRGGQAGVPIWLGFLVAAMGSIFLLLGIVMARQELRFGDEGVQTTGVVTAVRIEIGTGDDADTHYVHYRFVDAAGVEHGGQSQVDGATYSRTRAGDDVVITYLASDPTTSRVGTPEPQLLFPMGFGGMGALFGLMGPVLVITALRNRRGAAAAAAAGASSVGSAVVQPADLRRVDVFTRTPMAVFGLVAAPIAGLAFFAIAIYGLGQLGSDPGWIIGVVMGGFFGLLLVASGVAGLRSGLGLRMAEIGPNGIWLRGLGQLAWSEVGEVRVEQARGIGAQRGTRVGMGVGAIGVSAESESVTASYRRLGIIPRDPALANPKPGLARLMSSAFIRFLNTIRPGTGLTDPIALSTYGINAAELEQPLDEVVASIRRFLPAEGTNPDAATNAPSDAAPGTEPVTPASAPFVASLGAGFTPQKPVTPAATGPSIVEVRPDAPAVPASRTFYRGSRGSILDGVEVEGGLVGTLITAAIGAISANRRNRPSSEASGVEVLRVGPDGISIPDLVDLAWPDISSIDVQERDYNDAPDNILMVVPRDAQLTETREPPRGSAWTIGRVGGSLFGGGGTPAFALHLRQVDAPTDEILDVIAQYRVVDEGT